MLAVSNAFIDAFLATADSLVTPLLDQTTGLLTQPPDIPVPSRL